jgi:hypothetical protein
MLNNKNWTSDQSRNLTKTKKDVNNLIPTLKMVDIGTLNVKLFTSMDRMLSHQHWMKYLHTSVRLMTRQCISIFKESTYSLAYIYCSCTRATVVKAAKASRGLQRFRVRILLRTKNRLFIQRRFNYRIRRCSNVVGTTLIQRCIVTSVWRFTADVASIFNLNLFSPRSQRRNR